MKLTDKLVAVSVSTTFKVTLENGRAFEGIKADISFDGMTLDQVLQLARKSVVISRQNALRGQSEEVIRKLQENGDSFHALDAGSKPKDVAKMAASLSNQDTINLLLAKGYDKEKLALLFPELAEELQAK